MNYFIYVIIGVFTIILIGFIIYYFQRKSVIKKICSMEQREKNILINNLAKPFGFLYLTAQDIITSQHDAWQKDFGYCFLYDKSAASFHMIFDCEPVYFVYENCTWLIEFWKGQYGISTGCEIGIYRADTIIAPEEYERTLFHSVPKDYLLPLSLSLNYKGQRFFSVSNLHWWLTGFRIGKYCNPEDLSLDISITFPCEEMLYCFVESLVRMGYSEHELCICHLTVSFCFSTPHSKQPRHAERLRAGISQFVNRLFCRLYILITRPFTCTTDRILYLYYFLPILFRRLLRFKRNRKQKYNGKSHKIKL